MTNRNSGQEGQGKARGRSIVTLDGVVFFLLALADLADRAARAPMPVRVLVLWILRRANTVATDYVEASAWDMPGRYWSPAFVFLQYGPDPADPASLARSFRTLARLVQDMAAHLRRLSPEWPYRLIDDPQVGLNRRFLEALEGLLRAGRLEPARLDTS